MTFKNLLKRLQKMTPDQLKKKARLYEGCSGNWTEVYGIYITNKETLEYDPAMGEQEPPVKLKEPYLVHDH